MKAAVCRTFGAPLVIEDVVLASPRRGEVKVKISACAICHSDLVFASGAWGGNLPAVYGHEAAGVITELGEGVSDYSIRNRVLVTLIRACGECASCGDGYPTDCEGGYDRLRDSPLKDAYGNQIEHGMATAAFAEEVVVDQSQIARIPDSLPMEEACLLACGGVTGIGAVINAAKLKEGASAVVVGAGGVGLNTLQGAAISGADPLIVLDIDPKKLDAGRQFGATHAIHAQSTNVPDQVRDLTSGRGADFVFVTVGSVAAYEESLRYLAPRGSLIMVGMTPSGAQMKLEPVNIASASQTLQGTKMGDTVLERDLPKLFDWYEKGALNLKDLITARYSLEEINQAIEDTKKPGTRRNVILF